MCFTGYVAHSWPAVLQKSYNGTLGHCLQQREWVSWMFVVPHVGILMTNVTVLGGGAFPEVFSSEGWSPPERAECPYKIDPSELPTTCDDTVRSFQSKWRP